MTAVADADLPDAEIGETEPEPMKLWPPSPKTKILLIGLAFIGFQAMLMITFAIVLWWRISND